jgi:hypothetical protein
MNQTGVPECLRSWGTPVSRTHSRAPEFPHRSTRGPILILVNALTTGEPFVYYYEESRGQTFLSLLSRPILRGIELMRATNNRQ